MIIQAAPADLEEIVETIQIGVGYYVASNGSGEEASLLQGPAEVDAMWVIGTLLFNKESKIHILQVTRSLPH